MWAEGKDKITTIYYYSEAANIIMGKTSSNLFYNMYALSNLSTISTWDTAKVTNMSGMFFATGLYSSSFVLDLSSWNTSSVTNMSQMFSSAGYSATTWSITIPKTNNGTATGPILNTTSCLYDSTTSVNATPPSGRSFILAN